MSKRWFLVAPLMALIFVGLLILGGLAIHRFGWSEGYRMGQLAVGGGEGAAIPYAPYGLATPRLFLTLGVMLLLLIVVGKVFRFWAWKTLGGPWMMAGGPAGGRWARHWHRPHGPVPPWCWGWEKPSEEKPEEAEPGTETGNAGAQI